MYKFHTSILASLILLCGCSGAQYQYSIDRAETEYRKALKNAQGSNQRDEILLETVEERSYTEEILRCEHYMKKINEGTPEEKLVFDSNSCGMEEVQRVRATQIEMPQEWLNQWPSLEILRDSKDFSQKEHDDDRKKK